MSNAKDGNNVNLNPEEFSLKTKVSPTTEIASATETTEKLEIIQTTKETLTEEYSWTLESDSQNKETNLPDKNFPYQAPAPVQPAYCSSDIQNIMPFPQAGLTMPMMQQINNQVMKNFIDIKFSLMKCEAMSEEKLRQRQRSDLYEDSRKKTAGLQQGDETVIASSLDWKKLEDSFIKKYAIVKIRVQAKADFKYAFLERDYNRHIIVDSKYLNSEYLAYIDEQTMESINFPQGHFNRSLQRLLHKIPRLEKSDLIQLQPQKIMMNNGFLDLHTLEFTNVAPENRQKFFTLFSLDIDFKPTIQNPDAFDALLYDSLGSPEAVSLAYEQIGAILTPVTTIKKIFAFQGKSQGGKTRLSNIITRLMQSDDTKFLNSLSEISDDKQIDNQLDTLVRLVYIKEVGKNKLPAKQIVKLKAFADGSDLRDANAFKILLNTNYPIVTGDNLSLEPALANRLSVLPFPKSMDNVDPAVASFEDVYFEKEKPDIILKALLAFSNVLKNKNNFSFNFEPNVCIEDYGQQIPSYLSDTERQNFSNVFQTLKNNAQPKISQLLDEYFQTVENVNPEITTNVIFQAINKILPNALKDSASTGKRLSQHFGEKLKTSRNNQGETCYNLAFTNLS